MKENNVKKNRTIKLSIFAFLLVLLFILKPVTGSAVTITFDEYAFSEGDAVTNQYENLGVIFSSTTNPPVIAQPQTGRIFGFVANNGQDDLLISSNISGGNMLTDCLRSDPYPFVPGSNITATFTIPVTRVDLYVIDIDVRETYTLSAYNKATGLIASQTFSSGEPGTGDGIPTLFSLSASLNNPINYVVLDVPDRCGFAIDDFSFTPVPSPIPEPTTVFLLGTGLFGLIGIGRKNKISFIQ